MALPPTIPTSFTPRPPAAAARGFRFDFMGAFGFLSYFIFLVVITLAVVVFLYSQVLSSKLASKDAELAEAEAAIDTVTAENFVRLDNRLSSGKMLLTNHVLLSRFFTTLGNLLPASVRFSGLRVTFVDSKKVTLEGTGVAKNFNALAAASASLAGDGHIKDAIFSHLVVNKDGSVVFTLSAEVARDLVSYPLAGAAPAEVAPLVSTSTASTASTTPTP